MPRLQRYRWAEWANKAAQRIIITDRPEAIAVDTETTGLGFHDEAFCVTAAWRRPNGALQSAYFSLEHGDYIKAAITDVLAHVPTWVFHNSKFDLQKLLYAGLITEDELDAHAFEDTEAIYHLEDENRRKALKSLAREVLGEETNEEKVLAKVRRQLGLKKADGFEYLPREVLVPYAVKDAEFTLRLYEQGKPALQAPELLALYEQEIQLTRVLLRMESNGLGVDTDYLEERVGEYAVRTMRQYTRIVELSGNEELNVNAPAQVREAFLNRGIKLPDTKKDTLAALDDDLARSLLEYRQDSKAYSAWLRPLLDEQRDGVAHPWIRQHGTRTGRTSSGTFQED
jgi:DNA polymerase I-like protein with 3'-5' exonuclease and polymerase domains